MKGRALIVAGIAIVALVLTGCGGADDTVGGSADADASSGASVKLSLVAYSTPQVVYDEIIPDFQKTEAGSGIAFSKSFGASGDQSRAVEAGLAADVVTFSIAPDVERLVKAGLVDANWAQNEHEGLVTKSVVTFIVRKGNPKNIRSWDDLLKPGVEVLTPNPFTSGAAKWNLLAAYGAKAQGGKDPAAGLAYVRELITEHVKVQDKSGREALQNFIAGTGDVLLSYEYEATTANKKGEDLEYVIPDDTISIEILIARLKDSKHPGQAQAFIDYVLSDPAQQRFADWGYRPVNEAVLERNKDRFPTPPGLFTIDDLGGWSKVNDELFDPDNGSIAEIEREAGVSTAK